ASSPPPRCPLSLHDALPIFSPYVITAIGSRNARRYFATAEVFDAAEAMRIGLLHAVVPADALDAAIDRQIALLLKAAPHASADAKRLVREAAAATDRDRLDQDRKSTRLNSSHVKISYAVFCL